MLTNYFKTAFRSLWKNRGTSLVNIGGLAVGMTAAVLIMLWVKNELGFDNYHANANKVYRITTHIEANNWTWESTPLLLADAVKREVPEVEYASRLTLDHWPVVTINTNAFYEKECAYVDNDWFRIFSYDFIAGNATSFDQHIYSIILSASTAKKYFGDRNAVGQTVLIDGKSYTVQGVVADAPVNSSFQYTAFMPIAALMTDPQKKQNDEQWNNYNYITFIQTKTVTNEKQVNAKINAILRNNDKEGGGTTSLTALKDIHFETGIQNSVNRHGNINTVYVFGILAFFLLLIACINYVNLTTAKASLRAKEVSIRKITGAGRTQLFLQFITESFVISTLSLFATLLLVKACLPAFNELTGRNFSLPFTSPALWQTAGITLLVAFLLNSIYPALMLSSFKPIQVFRGASVLKVKDQYFRKGLVVLQFVVSVILIAGTLVIYSQMNFIQQTNPGYNRSAVLSFAVPPTVNREERPLLMQTIKQQLLSQSSVQQVTTTNQSLVNLGSMCSECADWEGRDISDHKRIDQIQIAQLAADADFANTMQLQMKEGRWFSNENVTDKHNVVLNETAVQTFGMKLPVTGKRFMFKGDTGQVIGVVKDFSFRSLHEKTGPLVAFSNEKWRNHFLIRIAPGNASTAVAGIEKIWKQNFPATPLEYNFLDDTFNNLYKEDQKTSMLVLVFAIIAIVISALGLFSLAAFAAEQRTKEIGIRKVLGATVTNITALISKDFVQLVGVAILIALPIAWWAMHQWIQNFAYRIGLSWWIFLLAGIIAIVIALVTVSFQALKAAVVNPVKSLKAAP